MTAPQTEQTQPKVNAEMALFRNIVDLTVIVESFPWVANPETRKGIHPDSYEGKLIGQYFELLRQVPVSYVPDNLMMEHGLTNSDQLAAMTGRLPYI